MRIYNRYLAMIVAAACIIDITLSILGQSDLEMYFTLNLLAYLIITLLHVYFSPSTRKALSAVSLVLLVSFSVMAVFKIMEVMQWRLR